MNRTSVEQIKERLPIDVVVGSYVKLEKAGKSYKAKCPFHNEKSASFFVSPDRGGYYCFGCGAKGDIFSFVEQFEGLDFRGALKVLAEKAGVKLVYDKKADSERDRLYQVMELAADFFEQQLASSVISSKEAQDYVKSRGISPATQKDFRIGWAPDGWRNLQTYLKGKGWNDVVMDKVGLVKKKDDGPEFYDRFRGRVMFPITDSSGRVIAFSGRILKDDGKSAKYLNSPDTPLYDKSMVLYGLDKAKSEIRRMGYSIFVEGQMDLVMSYQAGIKNTVAASGTALGDETLNENGIVSNLGLVRRLSPNVIIAFDSDSAGRKAALRAAGIALSLGMDVKIAEIVGGKDPADLVKEDLEKWKEVLRHAKPVVEFELHNVIRDLTSAPSSTVANVARKLPRAINERVLPLLARIESATDQSYFVRLISEKANIPTDAIWQDLRMIERKLKEKEKEAAKGAGVGGTDPKNTMSQVVTSKIGGTNSASDSKHRIDLVERQIFGIIFSMEKINEGKAAGEKVSSSKVDEYRDQLKKIAGDSYVERLARAEAIKSDLIFEAEEYFGADEKLWERHANELILNFEEDILNADLFKTMGDLRVAEKAGDQNTVIELVKKCQVLSIRKAEILKRRK